MRKAIVYLFLFILSFSLASAMNDIMTTEVIIPISGSSGNGTSLWNQSTSYAELISPKDIQFNSYKAIALSCDNGNSLPTTATTGQWYLLDTTGRKVLYQYSGTAWIPIYNFGSMKIYVNKVTGTDNQNYGYDNSTRAFKSIQFAIDQIPPLNAGDITLNISEHTYSEQVKIQGKAFTGAYYFYLNGRAPNLAAYIISNTPTSYSRGGQTTTTGVSPSNITKTGIFTGYNLTGKFIQYAGTGNYYPIVGNTNDILFVADNSVTSVASFKIYEINTTIRNTTGTPFTVTNQNNLIVKHIRFRNTGTSSTIIHNPFSSVEYIECSQQGGNNANGQQYIGGSTTLTRTHYFEEYASRFAITPTGLAKVTLTGSLCTLSGTATSCLRENQYSFVGGNPSFFDGVGTGRAVQLLSGMYTIFGSWFKDFDYGVWSDGSGEITYQTNPYGRFVSVNYPVYRPHMAMNAPFIFANASGLNEAVQGLMGYNQTGDYIYMNFGQNTAQKHLTLNPTGFIGVNSSNPSAQLEVVGEKDLLNVSLATSEKLVVKSSGYVGVNTDSPSYELDIDGMVNTLGESGKTYRWDKESSNTPPSTDSDATLCYYGSPEIKLCAPDKWLLVEVDGIEYLVPAYRLEG